MLRISLFANVGSNANAFLSKSQSLSKASFFRAWSLPLSKACGFLPDIFGIANIHPPPHTVAHADGDGPSMLSDIGSWVLDFYIIPLGSEPSLT